MLLTVSKRLEFSASRRLHVDRWSDNENLAVFGPETNARYGSGRNYVAYFVFTGPVDPATGMLINISEIKERAGRIVRRALRSQIPQRRQSFLPSRSADCRKYCAATLHRCRAVIL